MKRDNFAAPGPPPVDEYELRLAGLLDASWAARFDGLTLQHELDGTTALRGRIVDQAALHGVLQRVRDLGLSLVSVTRVDHAPDPSAIDRGPSDDLTGESHD